MPPSANIADTVKEPSGWRQEYLLLFHGLRISLVTAIPIKPHPIPISHPAVELPSTLPTPPPTNMHPTNTNPPAPHLFIQTPPQALINSFHPVDIKDNVSLLYTQMANEEYSEETLTNQSQRRWIDVCQKVAIISSTSKSTIAHPLI